MSALDTSAATVPRRPSRALLVGLPLLAALLGAVMALVFQGDAGDATGRATAPPPGRAVAAGDLRLTLPEGWRAVRTGTAIPGFKGARAAFMRSESGVDVAIAMLPASARSLLPRRLDAARSPGSSEPRVTRVGAGHAYHYVRALGAQRLVDVYAVPTTRGIATIACSTTYVAPGECELVLPGLRLTRGSLLPLSVDAGFLVRVPAIAATLDARRARLRARLARASRPDGAARTVARLAGIYAAAGHALRPLVARRSEASKTLRLLGTLRVRYGRLGAALRTRDRSAFARTARAIGRDESRLAARLEGWQRVLAPYSR